MVLAMVTSTNPRVAGSGGQPQATKLIALECGVLLLEPGRLVHWTFEDDVELGILRSSFQS